MLKILQGISHVISPRVCRVCGQSLAADEDVMCLECFVNLPRANIHRDDFNAIHERLGHKACVDKAGAWYLYKRNSPYAQMLVDAKYRDLPRLAYKLGRMCAQELQPDGFFDGIEMIVPMPMHWYKRLKRGYNQAVEIARGIADVTGLEVCQALKAARSHGVQSRNTRDERYEKIRDTLEVPKPELIAGRSVLFVDDIITTGASASEGARILAEAQPRRLNVLCIGLTMMT